MRVLLLNQYFHPDLAPTAQLASDLGEALARAGHEVHAVASNRPYAPSGIGVCLPRHERTRGVQIHRVPSTAMGRGSHLLRAVDYVSYMAGAAVTVLGGLRPDVVVALSTPPLLAALGLAARELQGTRLVLWVMDVYPEVAIELGALARGGIAARLVGGVSRLVLARADAVVALDEAMRARLIAGGAPSDRVEVVDNWCDGAAIRPLPSAGNGLRRELGIADEEFVVSYSGNMGHGHDFDTVVEAMALLAGEPVRWLFIGDGPRRVSVERAIADRGLAARAIHLPYRPSSALPLSLTAADASLVTLKERLAGLIVPSKLYAILAAGVPVLYVGPPEGRAHEVAGAEGAGASLRNGDATGLAAAIQRLRTDEPRRADTGRRARHLYELRFTRERALALHQALLERIVARPIAAAAPTGARPTGARPC